MSFCVRYHDQKLIFVFDHSTKAFLTSDIFIKAAIIANNEYLRDGTNFNINAFFINWFISKKKKKEMELLLVTMNIIKNYLQKKIFHAVNTN